MLIFIAKMEVYTALTVNARLRFLLHLSVLPIPKEKCHETLLLVRCLFIGSSHCCP